MGPILLRVAVAAAVLLGAGAAIGSRLGSAFVSESDPAPIDPHLVAPSALRPSTPSGALRPSTPSGALRPSAPPSPSGTAPPATRAAGRPATVPQAGPGRFTAASAVGPVRGTAGPLHRYRVTVEGGTGQDPVDVASIVDSVLGDPRGWTANGSLRLQLVPGDAYADFSVLLATPRTSQAICATGGLRTGGYSSCRLPGRVVLNLARWLTAVPNYGATVEQYRQYLVNHEIGHQLGHGHEACTGPGRPAPVMQQQTYRLDGCVANAWPYVGGKRYAGRSVK